MVFIIIFYYVYELLLVYSYCVSILIFVGSCLVASKKVEGVKHLLNKQTNTL